MAQQDFKSELEKLGYKVEDLGEGKVAFPFEVPCGKFSGQQIKIGFVVPADYNLTPPPGPHISPRLLPIHPGGNHPSGGVNDSQQFGADWQYWSRPMHHWGQTSRDARAVMAHIRHLFDTQ